MTESSTKKAKNATEARKQSITKKPKIYNENVTKNFFAS